MKKWVSFVLVITFWKILSYIHLFLALTIRITPWIRKRLPQVVKDRFEFEHKNREEENCHSFYIENKKATFCFQVSSEGEFEQVRWIIEHLLNQSMLVEIIFTSPSVEHRILNLAQKYQGLLRYLRTPIMLISTPDLSGWITADTIFLVRYDFYPMIISMANSKNLVLLWFFRPGDQQGIVASLKWNLLLPLFMKVVASNQNDWWWLRSHLNFHELWSVPMDFRSLSIIDRIEKKEQTLEKFFPDFSNNIRMILKSVPKSIIHGNAYLSELVYLNDPTWKNEIENKKLLLAIVAHIPDQLNAEKLAEYYNLNIYEFSIGMKKNEIENLCREWEKKPGILIFKGKGFLLELYSEFLISLVGGGFEKNTHSLLEPFLAGVQWIYCGPRVFRSSEYYKIKELDSQKVICLATIYQWKTEVLRFILSEKFTGETRILQKELSKVSLQNQVITMLKELSFGH